MHAVRHVAWRRLWLPHSEIFLRDFNVFSQFYCFYLFPLLHIASMLVCEHHRCTTFSCSEVDTLLVSIYKEISSKRKRGREEFCVVVILLLENTGRVFEMLDQGA